MNFITLQSQDVEKHLDYLGCIEAMKGAMGELSECENDQPLRQIFNVDENSLFAVMPGIAESKIGLGSKIVTAYKDEKTGKSFHKGIVSLFNKSTGDLDCVADAHTITKIRTACASALATQYLSRIHSKVLSVFGTGTQAEAHIIAISLVRPIERVLVCGRDFERTKQFVNKLMKETGLNIIAIADAEEAASEADIICTVTSSDEPVVFRPWIKEGTHLNIVGSSYNGPVEIDESLVVDSVFFVDYKRSALVAAAEFIKAKKRGLINDDHIKGEIGEIINGKITGRTNNKEITVYKSLGHIFQDLAAVRYIFNKIKNT